MIQKNDDRDPVEELAEEFLERRRQGESITPDDYARQYPEWAHRIRDLFPMLLMVEDSRDPNEVAATANQHLDAILRDDIQRLGDFRIIRRIGHGGMGVVFEAEQESLGRRVALKLMSAACLTTPKQLKRFEREAQAAAKLHHTNIVPVFGVGEQGSMHYYIMQLIDGHSLDVELNNSDSPLRNNWRRIAEIGEQTASALEHAHSQGVLHRDIKPANLLLGEDDAVWITDFGLAKLFDQDDVTRSGDAVGTLRYMAPEQLSGITDQRSDVYSLGTTLYELLIFRPAYDESDRSRLIQRLAHEDPTPPRSFNSAIPSDLETIVLKAMARRPDDRYENAAALADDLNRFLDDRPIQARRISLIGRLWRWSHRNPAIASLTAITFTLAVLVAVVASVAYVRTNVALDRESHQRQLAEHERGKADTERRRAEFERDRAEGNLRSALDAIDEMFNRLTHGKPTVEHPIDDYFERFYPVVRTENAAALQGLLKFLEQFADRNGDDPKLQLELAKAHRRMGGIYRQLGQFEKSEAALRRALATYEQVAANSSTKPGFSVETASLHTKLGLLLFMTGRYSEADKSYASAQQQLESLRDESPHEDSVRLALAKVHTYQSDLLRMTGRLRESIGASWRAVDILETLKERHPESPAYRHMLAVSYRGTPHRDTARDREAQDEAIRILLQLTNEFPGVPVYRLDLSEAYAMAEHHFLVTRRREQHRKGVNKEHLKEAEDRLKQAVVLGEELVTSYPAVPQYKVSLASSMRKLGRVMQDLGRAKEAEDSFREAYKIESSLEKRFPQVPGYVLNLAEAQQSLGDNLRIQGRFQDARPLLEQAIKSQEEFLESVPDNDWAKLRLSEQHRSLGTTLDELGNFELSRQHFQKARKLTANIERIAPGGRRSKPPIPYDE